MLAEIARIVIYHGIDEDGEDAITLEFSEGLTILNAVGLLGYAQAELTNQLRREDAP